MPPIVEPIATTLWGFQNEDDVLPTGLRAMLGAMGPFASDRDRSSRNVEMCEAALAFVGRSADWKYSFRLRLQAFDLFGHACPYSFEAMHEHLIAGYSIQDYPYYGIEIGGSDWLSELRAIARAMLEDPGIKGCGEVKELTELLRESEGRRYRLVIARIWQGAWV